MTETAIVWIVAVFALAGLVKGVIGMGLPTVAIALLGLLMHPMEAAALMVVPSLITNVWQALVGTHLRVLIRRLFGLLAGVGVGTLIAGAGALGVGDATRAAAALGIALMIYAALGLFAAPLRVPARHEKPTSAVAGLLTGLISGSTGIFVIPSVPYLQSLNLSKDELVQAMGLTFTVATVFLGTSLVSVGRLDAATAGLSALALLPAILGLIAGQAVRGRIGIARFRLCFFVGTFLLGAHLALKALLPA